jgi:predicted  nucleic acid-binding Zn-ribbon protein
VSPKQSPANEKPAPSVAADEAPAPPAEEKKESSGLTWKVVSGLAAGLVLSAVGAAYHNVQSQLRAIKGSIASASKEMRGEVSRLSKSQNGMTKKDELNTRLRNVWDRLKELQAGRTDLTSLRERCALLGELYKAGEAERAALAEQVRKMKEKGRAAEEKAELTRQVNALRERIASLESKPAGGAEEAEKP